MYIIEWTGRLLSFESHFHSQETNSENEFDVCFFKSNKT